MNYNDTRGPVDNIRVAVRLPNGKTIAGVRLLSPDGPAPASLQHALNAGFVEFSAPRVQTYSVAVIDLR